MGFVLNKSTTHGSSEQNTVVLKAWQYKGSSKELLPVVTQAIEERKEGELVWNESYCGGR